MPVINRIAEWQDELAAWRRELHAHPELAFEEARTAAFVAERLRAFGVDEVHTGIASTGVVGVLRAGGGRGSIGLTFVGAMTIGYLEKILSINAVGEASRLMLTGAIIVGAVLFQMARK